MIRRRSTPTSPPRSSGSTGPDGFDSDYVGLTDYFASIQAAFGDRTLRRGIMVVEGNHIACQTWIEGTFVREFTQSPAGPLPPNGQRVVLRPRVCLLSRVGAGAGAQFSRRRVRPGWTGRGSGGPAGPGRC